MSAGAGVAFGGQEIGGVLGDITAVDLNGSSANVFGAPYGGFVFGGDANGGGSGAPSNHGGGLGFFASAGPAFFIGGAPNPGRQQGTFDTHIVTLGVFSITIDMSPLKKGESPTGSRASNISVGPRVGFDTIIPNLYGPTMGVSDEYFNPVLCAREQRRYCDESNLATMCCSDSADDSWESYCEKGL